MIAVEILNEFDDTIFEGMDDHLNLLWRAHELDHFLQGSSPVAVERNASLGTNAAGVDILQLYQCIWLHSTQEVREVVIRVLIGRAVDCQRAEIGTVSVKKNPNVLVSEHLSVPEDQCLQMREPWGPV